MGRGQKSFNPISCYGIIVFIVFALLPVQRAEAQYDRIYEYHIETAQKAFEQENYRKALIHFDAAYRSSPSRPRPKEHIFLIKYFTEGEQREPSLREPLPSLEEADPETVRRPHYRERIAQEKIPPPVVETPPVPGHAPREKPEEIAARPRGAEIEALELTPEPGEDAALQRSLPYPYGAVAPEVVSGTTAPLRRDPPAAAPEPRIVIASQTGERPERTMDRYEPVGEELVPVLLLDQELWKLQPNTFLEITLYRSLIIEPNNLRNALQVHEGFLDIQQLPDGRLLVTAKRRGSTFLHIWDEQGRWTFNVSITLPLSLEQIRRLEKPAPLEIPEDPFRFVYSNDWRAFYRGDELQGLERRSLSFRQFLGLYGDTPYGKFDGSMTYYKFEESTEVTQKSIGLTDGRIGPFRDFTIRGYDTFKRFSALTLPGRTFRGFLFESYAFNRDIHYTYLRGKDRSTFLLITPGIFEEEKSYIEGAQITFFPERRHSFSFNALRGFGDDRPEFLKERVFSVESRHDLDDLDIQAEAAYDEDVWASYANTLYKGENYSVRMNIRDIQPGFDTISGRPGDQGEAGINLVADRDWENMNVSANIDVYRDREQKNPDDPGALNIDLATTFSRLLDEWTRWNSSFFYSDTPQLISPREWFRVNNRLTRSFALSEFARLSAFVGHNYQQSRFSNNPAAEFDRHSVITGVSFPLARYVSAFANYEYSWVEAKAAGEKTNPRVFTSGISYSGPVAQNVSVFASLNYRNEEESERDFSFLAGEDSIRGSLSLTYAPFTDVSVFVDGQLQKLFPEDSGRADFWEADVRMGVRTAWNLPLRWSPAAEISGVIFKDLNGNGLRDEGEEGVPDVAVQIGEQIVRTDAKGEYYARVRAKKVLIAMDLESVPQGFMASTSTARELTIEQGDIFIVDFGLSTRTRIYGVVYHDENENGSPDANEKTFVNVRMILDDQRAAFTDHDGVYVFEDVIPGTHVIRFEVNSLPRGYLPKIKISNEVTVTEGTTYIFHVPLSR